MTIQWGQDKLRGYRWQICLLLMLAYCGLAAAQPGVNCPGPPGLLSALAAHSSAETYNALGVYFGGRQLYPCAISAFESALRLQPDSWQAHYNLAIALNSSGNTDRAYNEMLAASRINPTAPQVHLGLGLVLSRLNQPDAALHEFQIALKDNPASIPALHGVTQALIAQRKYSAAIQALKDPPADPELETDRAVALSRNGDDAQAIQILLKVLESAP